MGRFLMAGSMLQVRGGEHDLHAFCSGEEADKITKFKDVLGLSPEDAAAAHIDVGRRFLRLANEAGGRGAKGEYRKARLLFAPLLVFAIEFRVLFRLSSHKDAHQTFQLLRWLHTPLKDPMSGQPFYEMGLRSRRLGSMSYPDPERNLGVQALNKLIYVSGLVFGERQEAFLLPWKRVCDYNDAAMYVAKRDQAKALFKSHLNSKGAELPVTFSLRFCNLLVVLVGPLRHDTGSLEQLLKNGVWGARSPWLLFASLPSEACVCPP